MIRHMRLCPYLIHHHSPVVSSQIHCSLWWRQSRFVSLLRRVGHEHSVHVCTGVHFGNHSIMSRPCTYVGIRIFLYRLAVVDLQVCKQSSWQIVLALLCISSLICSQQSIFPHPFSRCEYIHPCVYTYLIQGTLSICTYENNIYLHLLGWYI